MQDYNYGSTVTPRVDWVQGTVIRGSKRHNTRKGQTFNAGGRKVITNRVNGRVRSITVLAADGTREAQLAPDARLW